MLVLTFQIGGDRVALDIRRILEVVPRVRLQRPAGAPEWLAGVFVCRGRVVPVIDLHRLAGAGECPAHLSSRIILLEASAEPGNPSLGLLAAQVAEIRELPAPAPTAVNYPPADGADLGPVVVEGNALFRMLDLERLLPEPVRRHLAALPKELSCP